MKKRAVPMLLLALAAALAFAITVGSGSGQTRREEADSVFTTERWLNSPERRADMLGSLMTQYNGLSGLSREEVEALLGAGDGGGPDTYRIGKKGGYAGQMVLLRLYYEDAVVVNWGIYEDSLL